MLNGYILVSKLQQKFALIPSKLLDILIATRSFLYIEVIFLKLKPDFVSSKSTIFLLIFGSVRLKSGPSCRPIPGKSTPSGWSPSSFPSSFTADTFVTGHLELLGFDSCISQFPLDPERVLVLLCFYAFGSEVNLCRAAKQLMLKNDGNDKVITASSGKRREMPAIEVQVEK